MELSQWVNELMKSCRAVGLRFWKNRISGTYLKNKFQELEEFKIEALRGEVLLEPDRLITKPANYRRQSFHGEATRGIQNLGMCLIGDLVI